MTPTGASGLVFKARIFLPSGELATVERSALSLAHLRAEVERDGNTLLSAQAVNTTLALQKNTQFPLLVFCQQLLSLLDAGLQLVEAVDTLTDKEQEPQHRKTLLQLQGR